MSEGPYTYSLKPCPSDDKVILEIRQPSDRRNTPTFCVAMDKGLAEFIVASCTAHAAALASTTPACDKLRGALEEIAKGEGPYSRDALVHAENCIEHMKRIARAALADAEREGGQ